MFKPTNTNVNFNTNLNHIEIKDDKIIFNNTFNEPLYNYIKILVLKDMIFFGSECNQKLSMLPSNIIKIF